MATITQLEYVIAVDQERHFGRASKFCHVSQPSLSLQIQKLEDEIDAIIFDRSSKPILPTEIGKEIISQAKIVLKEHKKIGQLADISHKEPRGEFHLGVIPTIAPDLIPLFVGKFSKKFPQIKLKINEYKTEDIVKLLLEDKLDAGLLVTPLKEDQLIERHLFYEPFYAYISEDHELASRKILSESDLSGEGLWLLEEGHCFRDQVLKVCSLGRKNSALSNVEFASGNLETLKNMVRRNSGYTLLPELALLNMSKGEKNAHIKKLRKPTPTREVSLVHRRSFLKEVIINAMEETILEELPPTIHSLKKDAVKVVEFL